MTSRTLFTVWKEEYKTNKENKNMNASIKKYMNNGGKREIFYVSLLCVVLLTLAKTLFALGGLNTEYIGLKYSVNQNAVAIEVVKSDIADINTGIAEIKQDLKWIIKTLK